MEVSIRPLVEEDAKRSFEWRNDPDIWRYTGSRPDKLITIDDEIQWIRKVMTDITSRRFAILADDRYVGNIYLTDITGGQAEYHIFIGDKRYWGKGIAKEASRTLIEFADKELGLSRITLKVNNKHIEAIHLYEKLGFLKTDATGELMEMTLNLTGKSDE